MQHNGEDPCPASTNKPHNEAGLALLARLMLSS